MFEKIMVTAQEQQAYDVIVAGGGPAGCAAAIASAREGRRTLLIEATGALGGMGTMGLVPAWCPFSDQEKIIYRGLAQEIFQRSRAAVPHEPVGKMDWVAINPEALKIIYDELVSAAGVTILFHTQVCAVEKKDDQITGAVTANKNGLSLYPARIFIDCTGDADLACLAGAAFEQGNADGVVQPATHCFTLANVDTYAYEHLVWRDMHQQSAAGESIARQLMQDSDLDLIVDMHFCNAMFAPGAVGFNAGHIFELDATSPTAVSQAMIHGRKLAHQFLQGLKKYAPSAFANAYVAQTGPLMGIRESRRIHGDYQLTIHDYLERRSFADEIGRNCYYIDVHHTLAELAGVQQGTFDSNQRYERYQKGESHGIPYRCLTPAGLRNLLTAGRAIDCDSLVFGSMRVMPPCLVTGEAAGTAAALACAQTVPDVHALDIAALQARLIQKGAWLHLDQPI